MFVSLMNGLVDHASHAATGLGFLFPGTLALQASESYAHNGN